MSPTAVANLDTLVPSITQKVPFLRRTSAFIRLYNTNKKIKTMKSLKPLKKTVSPLNINRAISVAKNINMVTRAMDRIDYNA